MKNVNSFSNIALAFPGWKVVIFLLIGGFSILGMRAMPGDEDYLAFTDEMPAPTGGMAAIMKSISYPTMAQKAGVEGKVYVLAYINEKGGVDDVKVIKGIGAGCDEAAVAAVKKAKFSGGKKDGVPVKTKLSLSIVFKLK